ncbi:MAG: hypothetical protein OEY01_06120 [Desulfobulbaceae bacterium]|nr:hypothetical protein [Desulfobulbaceae bacterium]HIJ78686.1 hypothetical protein [Deltaproteobacteria bacterium]
MTTSEATRKAIRILMLSPFYFKLDLAARQALIREFCAVNHKAIAKR